MPGDRISIPTKNRLPINAPKTIRLSPRESSPDKNSRPPKTMAVMMPTPMPAVLISTKIAIRMRAMTTMRTYSFCRMPMMLSFQLFSSYCTDASPKLNSFSASSGELAVPSEMPSSLACISDKDNISPGSA